MSTRRASANKRKVQSPRRLTTDMRANTDAQEPVASIKCPEKYTMITPVNAPHVFITPNRAPAQDGARSWTFTETPLWLKVERPMVADTKATAMGKVVVPHKDRVKILDTPIEKNCISFLTEAVSNPWPMR